MAPGVEKGLTRCRKTLPVVIVQSLNIDMIDRLNARRSSRRLISHELIAGILIVFSIADTLIDSDIFEHAINPDIAIATIGQTGLG